MPWESATGNRLDVASVDDWDVLKTLAQTETWWAWTRNDPDPVKLPPTVNRDNLEIYLDEENLDEEDQAYLLSSPHRKELERRFGEIRAAQKEEWILSHASGSQLLGAMIPLMIAAPENLIPGAMVAKAGKAAKLFSLGSNARKYGIAAMGITGAEEAVIHANNERRTLGESMITIGGVGILGASVGKYIDAQTAKKVGIQNKLRANIKAIDEGIGIDPKTSFSENIAPSMGAEKLAAITSPLVRLLGSPSPSIRAFAEEIMEVPFYLSKNFDGSPTYASLEEDIKSSWQSYGNYMRVLDESFVKYIKGNSDSGIGLPIERMTIDLKNRIFNEGKMTFNEFDALVTKYRAGAVTDVPDEVKVAAKAYDEFFKTWEPEAARIWESTEGLAGQNYLTRRYNFALIAQDPQGFEDFLFDQYRRNVDDYKPNEEAKIRGIISNTIRKMSDSPDQRIDISEIFDETVRGPLRMRYFNFIDESELYKTDWVFHSSKETASYYTKSAVADIHFHKRFGTLSQEAVAQTLKTKVMNEFIQKEDIDAMLDPLIVALEDEGFPDPENLARLLLTSSQKDIAYDTELAEVYAELVDLMGKENLMGKIDQAMDVAVAQEIARKNLLSPDELKAMNKELELAEAMMQRVRGTYMDPNSPLPGSVPARTIDALMKFNNLRIGGGFLLSSFVDVGRPIMHMGFKSAYGPAFDAFIKGNKEVLEAMKASSEELRSWAIGNELYYSQRLQSMVDQLPQSNAMTNMERTLGKANDAFFILNGLTIWNEYMKKNVGIGVVDRLVTISNKAASNKVSKKDIAAAAQLGLSKEDLVKISKEMEAHGKSYKGVHLTNASDWNDKDLGRRFFNAVRKETDTIIVTPGVGDTPLIMSNTYVAMIGQYKTFALAATTRMLLRGVQQPDANMQNGLLVAIAAGMSIQMYKDFVNDRSRSPDELLAAGIDRSGILASLGMANQAIQASPFSGLALTGEARGGLPFSRNLGPTYGTVSDVSKIMTAHPQSGAAFERLNPLRSLFYIGDTLKVMENALEEEGSDTEWYKKKAIIPANEWYEEERKMALEASR